MTPPHHPPISITVDCSGITNIFLPFNISRFIFYTVQSNYRPFIRLLQCNVFCLLTNLYKTSYFSQIEKKVVEIWVIFKVL